MSAAVHSIVELHDNHHLSRHAWVRMGERSLSPDMIRKVFNYGRVAHVRNATIYAVGRKEVKRFDRENVDLTDVEGVQVVCSANGAVMTVYRNHDFRGLRPRLRRVRRCRA